MRGSPLRDFFLVLTAAGILFLPLFLLTRPRAPSPRANTAAAALAEAGLHPFWIQIRFSHPPEQFRLFAGDTLLLRGGGLLEIEEDLTLPWPDRTLLLRMDARWSDAVPRAYTEIRIEPDLQPELRRGFWASGSVLRPLEFQWNHPSPSI